MDATQEKTLEGIIAEHAPETKVATTNHGSGIKTSWLSLTDHAVALNERLIDWYGIIVLVLLWEIAPRQGWIDMQFFPSPSLIIAEGVKMATKDELLIQVTSSMTRLLRGLGAALAVGIPLGFLLGGWYPRLTHFLRPLLRLLGQINAFSLFPIFVLFFGIGELAKFAIIFWSCIWPILFTTIAGVQGVDPLYVKVARSMGSNSLTIFTRVLFPGALPSIFTGIRFGTTVGFLMLIAAEMIGASAGLGWMVWNAQINFQMPELFAATVLISALGLSLNLSFGVLESKLVGWKEKALSESN